MDKKIQRRLLIVSLLYDVASGIQSFEEGTFHVAIFILC